MPLHPTLPRYPQKNGLVKPFFERLFEERVFHISTTLLDTLDEDAYSERYMNLFAQALAYVIDLFIPRLQPVRVSLEHSPKK